MGSALPLIVFSLLFQDCAASERSTFPPPIWNREIDGGYFIEGLDKLGQQQPGLPDGPAGKNIVDEVKKAWDAALKLPTGPNLRHTLDCFNPVSGLLDRDHPSFKSRFSRPFTIGFKSDQSRVSIEKGLSRLMQFRSIAVYAGTPDLYLLGRRKSCRVPFAWLQHGNRLPERSATIPDRPHRSQCIIGDDLRSQPGKWRTKHGWFGRFAQPGSHADRRQKACLSSRTSKIDLLEQTAKNPRLLLEPPTVRSLPKDISLVPSTLPPPTGQVVPAGTPSLAR